MSVPATVSTNLPAAPKTPRERAIELRLDGVPVPAICEALNLTEQQVDRYIGDFMAHDATGQQLAVEHQMRKLEESDAVLKDIMDDEWPMFIQGANVGSDPMPRVKAALGRVKIVEVQNKMLALDKTRAPEVPVDKGEESRERQAAAMEEVLRRNGLLKRPAAGEVVDV